MQEFLIALATQGFLQSALAAGLLASIGCGLIGPYVVVKRIAFIAGGIAHSVLGGMGAALYFGQPPLAGALLAAVVAACWAAACWGRAAACWAAARAPWRRAW